MPNDGEGLRPWQQIAQELVNEKDPKSVVDLTEELNCALESQVTLFHQPPLRSKQVPRAS